VFSLLQEILVNNFHADTSGLIFCHGPSAWVFG
jgi:hypothetical protein